MPFNSYLYLAFLALAVTLFWLLPSRLRPAYVLAVSIFYYATWNIRFIVIPLGLCTAIFWLARVIVHSPTRARAALIGGIALVVATLGFFKYRVFLADTLNGMLFGGEHRLQWALALGLPLGISFYSFEAISFLIDTRQRRVSKPRFLDLANFIMFWPHLMAGPIVRVRELVPQLRFEQRFRTSFLIAGADRFLWGLVQKNALANPIGRWVDTGFRAGSHSTLDAWMLAVGFGLQVYFDFAGYTSMALGAAQMLGIKLPENFRTPYHSSTPPEFWSRWHMSLSRWIRDYLFFPVNARFHGAAAPLYISLIAIMAVVGLWHGAGWGFVVWGMMHGCYLVLYRAFETSYARRQEHAQAAGEQATATAASTSIDGGALGGRAGLQARVQEQATAGLQPRPQPAVAVAPAAPAAAGPPHYGRGWSVAWRIFTLVAVATSYVPFRAATLRQAARMMAAMYFRFTAGHAYPGSFYALIALLSVICALEPAVTRGLAAVTSQQERPALAIAVRAFAWACAFLLFMIFDQQDTQFIYFQF